jgi:hypothetical protein
VRIELNKGRVGIPLKKLSDVVMETERFLRMLAEDSGVDPKDGQWLGLDFTNGSVNFNAEYVGKVRQKEVRAFNSGFDDVRRGKPVNKVRVETRYQYARIAEKLDADEAIGFGTYEKDDDLPTSFRLSKLDLPIILTDLQVPVQSIGSIQGTIHSVYLGSQPPHFFLRELASDTLVKCIYAHEKYAEVAKALQSETSVVHVNGEITIDTKQRIFEQIKVAQITLAEPLSGGEFEEFFGCAPNLTGNLSTQEFIDKVRERGQST